MGPFVRLSTVSTLCISERTCICERISEPAAGIDLFVVYLLGDTFAEIVQNEFRRKWGTMPSEQGNRNPELPPWLDASGDNGEKAPDTDSHHQVRPDDRATSHASPQHERPQVRVAPQVQPSAPSGPSHAIESGSQAANDSWQPIAPPETNQGETQPPAVDPIRHGGGVQETQETAPMSPPRTRYVDSRLNQEATVAHSQQVQPSSSRGTNVRGAVPSNPPASAQPAAPSATPTAPKPPAVSTPAWDLPTTTFPAQGAGADSRGSYGSPGDSTSVPQPLNPLSYPQHQQAENAQIDPRPSVPSAGQVSSVPVENPQGQQQPHNGAPPQWQNSRPRQVNAGIASDFRSSTPPKRTIDDLDIIRRAKRPPAKGFRRFLFKLTGGKVNPGQSQAELEYLELVKRINQPSRGVYKIAFVSLKGGVGKTTAAKTVGSTFASLRGDRVIAIDANPDAGTLADREHREHRYTVRDLLADHQIRTYSDVRHYTSQGDSRLEILANETDPATSEAFNEQDYLDALKTLEVHYNIIITDCGTGMMHSAMKGILDEADAVVVVSPTAQDGARSAVSTLAWLNEQGHQRLVEKAVVVVNSTRPGSSSLDLSQLEDVFRQQGVRAVRIIPFDEHLGEGGPIDLPLLSKKTERAYLELAADLADDFVNKGPA